MSDLEGVEDTLFIPLAARVNISKKFPEYFYDPKSLEMEDLIKGKQVEKKSSEYGMIASVARYYNIDKMAQSFIDKYDKCNIVNLGAGLETSYYRLDKKNSQFFEVDLPEVIELRQKYLKEHENEKFIAGDLFKLEWINDIDTSLPTLMIVSGVFQYFHFNEIKKFIVDVQKEFENSELIFDATSKNGLMFANHFVKKTGNTNALMYFYIDDAEGFAKKTNSKLIECRPFYTDAMKILSKKIGFSTKMSMRIADRFNQAILIHLKL